MVPTMIVQMRRRYVIDEEFVCVIVLFYVCFVSSFIAVFIIARLWFVLINCLGRQDSSPSTKPSKIEYIIIIIL